MGDTFLSEEIIKYFNKFDESIIQNNNLYFIINKIFFTIIDQEKCEAYIIKDDIDKIKNGPTLKDLLLKNQKNENIKDINSEFSIENYKNIMKCLENCTYQKQFFPDLLEFCLINALIFVFYCEIGHTINIYLYDNFNKIKRGKTFENLEKNSFIKDILKEPFQKYLIEIDELTFNEETFCLMDEKKKIIPSNQEFINLFNKLGDHSTLIDNFFNKFEENIENLLNEFMNQSNDNNQNLLIKGILPLIYMGTIIKFKKIQYIYEYEKTKSTIPSSLTNYIYKQIQILYYYPKSSFNYIFYILFTVYKIKNSTQINLENVKFKYDISHAFLEFDSSFIMASVIKYDNRIKEIIFNQNSFGEIGLFETAKNICFNKNIKTINIGQMNIITSQLRYFNYGLENNYSVTELSLNNNIKIDHTSGIEIAKIIKKFKNLSILNLNKCKLERGLKYILKSIYENKIGITQLFLSKTFIDQIGIKILCDIVESKNCKIELLSVNNCDFNNKMGRKFLQSMTKNTSIEELYMYNCNLNDSYYNQIATLIISGNLNAFSLYKNNFYKFETILKLMSLTTTLNKEKNNLQSQLINLDLSVNPIKKESICDKHIDLFIDICKQSKLNSIDVSQIINGENPKPFKDKNEKDENNDNNKMDIDNDIQNDKYYNRVKKINEEICILKKENKDIFF